MATQAAPRKAKITVYIAQTLDGFIADSNGKVTFLESYEDTTGEEKPDDCGYAEFYETVGALIMGRTSYELVRGFADWPYKGKMSYVLSTSVIDDMLPDTKCFQIKGQPSVDEQLRNLIAEIEKDLKEGQCIWVMGGGVTIDAFLKANLVDELDIFVLPMMLGSGVPLFPVRGGGASIQSKLTLTRLEKRAKGIARLTYDTKAK
ncbi:uncharacterized protein YwjB-like [Saccoglossus kowalevskii]|uniref:Uncharacterized protein LOC102803477 n=1 Tax=Saccoglossus kowalevskii TaxID=10224 RepID=A0ABM0LY65_SACKO|nr:PREDICTED: uncharacterized protein LOC102803477 [Saccoglossus kowalevskii]